MVAAIVFAIWCAGLKTGAESSQTKEKYLIFSGLLLILQSVVTILGFDGIGITFLFGIITLIQFYFMCAKAECRDILDERRIKK